MSLPSVLCHDSDPHPLPRLLDEPRRLYPVFKRGADVLIAGTALVMLSPLFLIVALAIWIRDFGPVFFVQVRVGQRGREFRMIKFRSMIPDAEQRRAVLEEANEHQDTRTFKMKRDPRITPVGRLLRKSSLDELPQLWNILIGDMSLVGPRPAIPAEVAQYTAAERRRLYGKPGLTCLWQISGRADLPFPEQVRLDMEYLENQSLTLDAWILLRTIPAVISGKGAY